MRFFRACLLTFLIAMGGFFALQPLPSHAEALEVSRMDVQITANPGGDTFEVEEQLLVHFTEERHGYIRDIPVRYRTPNGDRKTIGVDVLSVDQGRLPATYVVSREGDNLAIKIGDADRFVSGDVLYTLRYRVSRAILYRQAEDELYWNITGTSTLLPKTTQVSVVFPGALDTSRVRATCFTGAYGEEGRNCTISAFSAEAPSSVRFSAEEQYVTIGVGLPKGYFVAPTRWEQFVQYLRDNLAKFAPFLLPVLTALLMYALWYAKGKDPQQRAIVTEFSPPESLTPLEIGAFVDGHVHDRDLSGALVDLAVRGYLKIIEEKSKDFTLLRTEKDAASLLPFEEKLVTAVFAGKDRIAFSDLKHRAAEFAKARKIIENAIQDSLVARNWYTANPIKVRAPYLTVAGFLVFPLFFEASVVTFSLAACAAVVAGFGWFMPQRTEAGARLYERVLGFREYLARAEKYRLEWQEKERIFEKFLPYAMVFGVVGAWTKALAPMMQQADWIETTGRVYDYHMFNSFSGRFTNAFLTATHLERSASGGGSSFSGGFSGGGFGGGGGRSW